MPASADPDLSRASSGALHTLILAGCLALGASGAEASGKGYANAAPTEVDVALVLAVDASQSMDDDEQHLQRDGYVGAITSPEVMKAISYGQHARIAVTYFEWGSQDQQVVVAPWTIIDGPEAARSFANRIAAAPLNSLQRTSISAALTFAAELHGKSGVTAARRVVDVSGDGPNNQGPVVSEARDALVSQGIVINGLPIVMKDGGVDWQPIPKLDTYYEDCVVGGEASFMIPVRGMENFGSALKMKLVMEIAGLTFETSNVIPAAGRTPTNCRYYE